MRWGTPGTPEYGSLRVRNAFLWLPKKIDGEWRWLEWAEWKEMYYRPTGRAAGYQKLKWRPYEWCR